MKLKTNIENKLSHFDTYHNCEVTRVKNKKKIKEKFKNNSKTIQKIQKKKNQKLTRGVDLIPSGQS